MVRGWEIWVSCQMPTVLHIMPKRVSAHYATIMLEACAHFTVSVMVLQDVLDDHRSRVAEAPSLRSAAPPSLEAGCWKNGGAPRYPCRYRERRERCPKLRFSVNIILTDPEPFSECLRGPEKSYRVLNGNLTEIHNIFWAAFTQCISWCVFCNFAFTGRTPRASSGSVRADARPRATRSRALCSLPRGTAM